MPQARREYQGLLLTDVLARAEAELGRSLPADWLARYEVERTEAFRRELEPVAGVAETVERLRGAGLRVCVASQGKLEKTRLSLALTGLDHLFPEHVRFSAYSVATASRRPTCSCMRRPRSESSPPPVPWWRTRHPASKPRLPARGWRRRAARTRP